MVCQRSLCADSKRNIYLHPMAVDFCRFVDLSAELADPGVFKILIRKGQRFPVEVRRLPLVQQSFLVAGNAVQDTAGYRNGKIAKHRDQY